METGLKPQLQFAAVPDFCVLHREVTASALYGIPGLRKGQSRLANSLLVIRCAIRADSYTIRVTMITALQWRVLTQSSPRSSDNCIGLQKHIASLFR